MISVMCGVLPIWKFNFGTTKVSDALAFEEFMILVFKLLNRC